MAKNKARVKIDAHEARLAAQREVYAQLDKIQADMSRKMTRDYMACLLLVLHDEYGFGNKRLLNVFARVADMAEALNMGLLSFKDIRETLIEEVGIDVEKQQVQRRKGDARWSPVRQPARGAQVRRAEADGGSRQDRAAGAAAEV